MVLAWRMQKVSQLSQPFLWLLLPAVVALWCLDHAWSHQSGMPRWYLPVDVTGGALGDETPTPNTTWWSSDCTRSTHRHTGKESWSFGIFLFFFLFLFIVLPARHGRENFQTVQKMRLQFPSLKHFCGCSGEGRDCRRAGSAFSVHFTLCSSCCESKVHTFDVCSGWMMPNAGSSSLSPERQKEFLQQKVACADRFTLPVWNRRSQQQHSLRAQDGSACDL